MRNYFNKVLFGTIMLVAAAFLVISPVCAEEAQRVEVCNSYGYEYDATVPIEYKSYGYYDVTLPTKFDNSNNFSGEIKVVMNKLADDRKVDVYLTNVDENGKLTMTNEYDENAELQVTYGSNWANAALDSPIATWYADGFKQDLTEITQEVHLQYMDTELLSGGTYNASLAFRITCTETDQ